MELNSIEVRVFERVGDEPANARVDVRDALHLARERDTEPA